MSERHFKRVLLKFSGEALSGEQHSIFDQAVLQYLAREIKAAYELGIQLGLVFGGGNIFRGISSEAKTMDRVKADYMGMLATVINALAMQDSLETQGLKVRVMSAIQMIDVAEPMVIRHAIEYLEHGEIVIFSAGTGRPYFSTDSGAVLRALEIKADVFIKATKVDGVYDKDPLQFPDAVLYPVLDYETALSKQLRVMDQTAFALCRDNNLPIIVYNLKVPGNLRRILTGEHIGTIVKRRHS